MAYATTISHEKKAKQWDKESIETRRDERHAYRDLTKEVYAYVGTSFLFSFLAINTLLFVMLVIYLRHKLLIVTFISPQ
jgi:hypothetical protein